MGLRKTKDGDKPAILVFQLSEFFETFGMSVSNFPKTVYDSPFFIYDRTLKEKGPVFEDEIPIGDEDFDLGFAMLETIWTEYVAPAKTESFSRIFKIMTNLESLDFFVESTYGFAPGYTVDTAIETIRRQNFVVITWEEFWSGPR